jgi:hypothetical protein
VGEEFKPIAGEKLDPVARHEAMRDDYIASARQLATSARLQGTATKSVAVIATDLLRRRDSLHPAPKS